MNNISRKCCAIFREENSFSVSYCTDIFREIAVISRDDSRVESYSFDSLPTKRATLAIVLAEMQNVFVSLRPESRDTFFSKQVPHRISEGRVRGRRVEEGEKRRGRKWETGREKGRAPVWNRYLHRFSNIFTFTTLPPPARCPLPLSTAIPLNLKPAT